MRTFVFLVLVAAAFAQQTAYFCEVGIPNFCSGGNTPCPQPPTFGSDEGYARQTVSRYGLDNNFNIISFGNFNGQSDTEGRVAVAGDFSVTDGYSIGDKIWTQGPGHTDQQLPYSLIVGRNLRWPSGALYPLAANNLYRSFQEDMFVGGTVDAPDYLASSVRSDSGLSSSLTSDFAAARLYYANLQSAFAAVSDNVDYTVTSNGDFNIICRSASASSYSLTIDGADFNRIRTYVFAAQCNAEVQFVFNVAGTGNVVFSGNNIAENRRAEIILFNILGSGRSITVAGASVRGNILAPNNNLNTVNGGYIQGFQVYGNVDNSRQINRVTCQPPAPVPHPPANEHLCPGFESDCAGLDITLPSPAPQTLFSFRDCNVVSFRDFRADTGDVEGRVCVARDFIAGDGYSVGFELSTNNNLPDNSVPASLIAGRDCSWASGSLHPDGTGRPHPGAREDAFCGGTFSGSSDLRARVTLGPCATPGCLDATFAAAQNCYNGYSNNFAAKPDNVVARVQWSGLFLTCNDITATEYVFSTTPEMMSQYTYYVLENCNFQAYWVMNVRGSGDVTFSGDFLATPNGAIVINVIGSRTIEVRDIRLNAHLLAPQATLHQTGGVIVGKVVAHDITMALQINHQNTCPDLTIVHVPIIPHNPVDVPPPALPPVPTNPPTPSTTNTPSSSTTDAPSTPSSSTTDTPTTPSTPSTPPGTPFPPTEDNCVEVYALASFAVGDNVVITRDDGSTVNTNIESITNSALCLPTDVDLPDLLYARQIGYAAIPSNDGRRFVANPPQPSSSSVVGISVALIALLALIL